MVQQEHAGAAEAAAASEATADDLRAQLAEAAAAQEAAVAEAAAAAEAELSALQAQLEAAQVLQEQLGGEAAALQLQVEGLEASHREVRALGLPPPDAALPAPCLLPLLSRPQPCNAPYPLGPLCRSGRRWMKRMQS
jgi:hypothetical protein